MSEHMVGLWKVNYEDKLYIIFFQAVKNSSSHRLSSILEKERNKGKKKDSLKQTLKKKEQG